jgi:hypothetical protein
MIARHAILLAVLAISASTLQPILWQPRKPICMRPSQKVIGPARICG